jgi:indolepyruvate ferredoxin oxidoreductase beta subunit
LKYGSRVYAPNIGEGEADVIVAFEKVEALRALPFLKRAAES